MKNCGRKSGSESRLGDAWTILLAGTPVLLVCSLPINLRGQVLALPDAPVPQTTSEPKPDVHFTSNGTPCAAEHPGMPAMTGAPQTDRQDNSYTLHPCPHHKIPQTSERFTVGDEPEIRTVKDKAKMTERDLTDPYDVMTVAGDSGISVASDPHSPYGPGMQGFGYDLGVGLGQDATSEVTNTFLIPAITHQDPQYHREPGRSTGKRIEHAFADVAWTKSDRSKGMPNYSNLLGDAGDDEIGDFYVPGEKRSLAATAERYGVGLALTPTDNLITEFTPDIASHVHVKSVFVQSIIDKVAGVTKVAAPVAAARTHGRIQPAKTAARNR